MRRNPITTLVGHLAWTRTGTVWATWRIKPLPYGYRPVGEKRSVRDLHRALWRAQHGEALILGLCAAQDPVTVVERMIAGVDLDACPEWAAECEATLDTLEGLHLGERTHWLSLPLANHGQARLTEPCRAALDGVRDVAALPRFRPAADVIAARRQQAQMLADAIPAVFQPTPASVAEQVWIAAHLQRRGMVDLPVPADPVTAELLTPRNGLALPEPVLDEGGQTDVDQRARRRLNPLDRRYLKVADPQQPDEPASYQCLMAIADVPAGGMTFPGSEYLGRLDECGEDVDYALRLKVNSRAKVLKRNRRAVTELNDQYEQREGQLTTGQHELDYAGKLLTEYQEIFANDELEVEVEHTAVLAVGDTDPDRAQARAKAVVRYLRNLEFKLDRPVGGMEELWWAMHIGAPTSRLVRQYAQFTTASDFAAAVPFITTRLGDRHGPIAALNTSTARLDVVHHDPAGHPALDISASFAFAGELGAGKALALDTPIPTPTGWARIADLAPGDRVFDEQGQPTVVLGASPVATGRRCFKVAFSDGSTITADADHAWTTIPARLRGGPAKRNYKARAAGGTDVIDLAAHTAQLVEQWPAHGATVTTQQLRDTLLTTSRQANHAVPTTAALELPEADLPVDAYVLGCWLGDGTSWRPHITSADPELLTFIEAAGYTVTKLQAPYLYAIALPGDPRLPADVRPCASCGQPMVCRYPHRRYCSRACATAAQKAGAAPLPRGRCASCDRELGASSTGRRCQSCWHQATLSGRLHVLGLLRNKHIPTRYLRASQAQRRALLAGLLDTDGTVAPGGPVEFSNTNRRLARDVHELACSLGYRATLREGRARLSGRDRGPTWTVAFTTTDQVFRLSRKLTTHAERSARSTPARTRFRYIVDVREVASVPVRCIRVASPSRLYLAGRAMIPTHNSFGMKTLAGPVVDRGGQLLAVDRTKEGEWAVFAEPLPSRTIVEVLDPRWSMDPLRVFGPSVGSRIAQAFITVACDVLPQSELGDVTAEVLDPQYLAEHQLISLGGVVRHLAEDCALDGARGLARRLRRFANLDLGRVVFDPDLPPVDLASSAIVWRTNSLELPTRDELTSEHLFRQMRLEKVFGRGYYTLITSAARAAAFADRAQFSLFTCDEAYYVTSSPESERDVALFVREGRRANAAVGLGSHDPEEDFGSETLRGLMPVRFLMRHRSEVLARRGLVWLGIDPEDPLFPALLKRLAEDTSPVSPDGGVPPERRGEGFMRDAFGGIGPIKILGPSRPARFAAALTSPTNASSQRGG